MIILSENHVKDNEKKKGFIDRLNGWYIFLALAILMFLNYLIPYDSTISDKYDTKKDIDWNNEQDVKFISNKSHIRKALIYFVVQRSFRPLYSLLTQNLR